MCSLGVYWFETKNTLLFSRRAIAGIPTCSIRNLLLLQLKRKLLLHTSARNIGFFEPITMYQRASIIEQLRSCVFNNLKKWWSSFLQLVDPFRLSDLFIPVFFCPAFPNNKKLVFRVASSYFDLPRGAQICVVFLCDFTLVIKKRSWNHPTMEIS